MIPTRETYTVMVNGPAFPEDAVHSKVRTTAGKGLERVPSESIRDYLDIFSVLIYMYNSRKPTDYRFGKDSRQNGGDDAPVQ